MRTKALLLSAGVAAALVAAVFVGAAAANTGAPVFYDARYPAPATSGSERYEVGEGGGRAAAVGRSRRRARRRRVAGDRRPTPRRIRRRRPAPHAAGRRPEGHAPRRPRRPTPAPAPDLRPPLTGQPEASRRPPAVADARCPGAQRGRRSRPGSPSSSSCASAWPMPDTSTSPGSGGIPPPTRRTGSRRCRPTSRPSSTRRGSSPSTATPARAATTGGRTPAAGAHAVHASPRNELSRADRQASCARSGGRDEFRDGAVQRSGIRSPEPDDGCREPSSRPASDRTRNVTAAAGGIGLARSPGRAPASTTRSPP